VTTLGLVATTDFTPCMKSEFGSAVASSAMYLDVNTTSSAVTVRAVGPLESADKVPRDGCEVRGDTLVIDVGISFASPFSRPACRRRPMKRALLNETRRVIVLGPGRLMRVEDGCAASTGSSVPHPDRE